MSKKEFVGRVLFFGIISVMIVLFVHKTFVQPKLLEESNLFTVAVTTKRYFAQTRGFRIRYVYHVAGKEYEGSFSSDDEVDYPGGLYLVKFSKSTPWVHEAYKDVEVPKRYEQAPDTGWVRPPFEIDR